MKTLIIEKIPRIIKTRRKLEEKLNVKITNRGKEVTIQGAPEDEFIAERVIDALNFGFPFSVAILIKEEDCIFEKINIKEHTNRKDHKSIRARVIGAKGKALKTLSNLSDCNFEIKDNCVGIIGEPESIKPARDALISLIGGAKHANVYKFLEKNQVKPIFDLGLKK